MKRCGSASSTGCTRRNSCASRPMRSEEHTSELQSRQYLVCRLLLEKKKKKHRIISLHQKMLFLHFSETDHLYLENHESCVLDEEDKIGLDPVQHEHTLT